MWAKRGDVIPCSKQRPQNEGRGKKVKSIPMTKVFSMSRAATPALQGQREIPTEILLEQHPLSIGWVLRAVDLCPPLLSSPSLKPTKGTWDALGSQEQMALEG